MPDWVAAVMSTQELRAAWPDAPDDEAECQRILSSAIDAWSQYGFTSELTADAPPVEPRLSAIKSGLVLKCRDIWNADHASTSTGDIGDQGFAFTPVNLDYRAKQLWRPHMPLRFVG